MPNQYREEILECWNQFSKEDNLLRFSPLTCFPEFYENDQVIVGINPSNSFNSLSPVLRNIRVDFELEHPINSIIDQNSYNEFLKYTNFEQSEELIIQLQHKCHEFHRHFRKYKRFLELMQVENIKNIDLFPIWETNQKSLEQFLNNQPELKSRLISSFFDFLTRNNVKNVLFLNSGAYSSFEKYFNKNIYNRFDTTINLGMRNLIFTTGEINHSETIINFKKIGIGGHVNLELLADQLNKNNISI